MLYFILVSVTLSSSAFAIDFLPCQRALSGSTFAAPDGRSYTLSENEVVLEGPLEVLREQGTGEAFCVRDRQIDNRLSGGMMEYPFMINHHAPVFLRCGDQQVSGRHSAAMVERMYTPRLLQPNLEKSVIPERDYLAAFIKRRNAIVITKLTPRELDQYNDRFLTKLKNLGEHISRADRFIDIGSGQIYECDSDERAFLADVHYDTKRRRGILNFAAPRPDLLAQDKVFLINAQELRIGSLSLGAFLDPIGEYETALVSHATRAVIIRRGDLESND